MKRFSGESAKHFSNAASASLPRLEQRERFSQREPRFLEFGSSVWRAQQAPRSPGPILLNQQMPQIFMRLGKRGRLLDRLAQNSRPPSALFSLISSAPSSASMFTSRGYFSSVPGTAPPQRPDYPHRSAQMTSSKDRLRCEQLFHQLARSRCRQIPAVARPRTRPPPPHSRGSGCDCPAAWESAGVCAPGRTPGTSAGNPDVSGPNTKTSPGANWGTSWRTVPRVEMANQRGLCSPSRQGASDPTSHIRELCIIHPRPPHRFLARIEPSGRIRCRCAPLLAHIRITLPVFGGISG